MPSEGGGGGGTAGTVTANLGTLNGAAQDGTDSSDSNATQATAGVGIRGWLSTLVSLLRAGTAKITVTQATASNLNVTIGNTTAAPVPTNNRQLTAATDTVTVTQATGTSLHAVLDTTSTTAVTQATGTNLHAVIDSGTVTVNALPAGTNIVGKVTTDQTTHGTTDLVAADITKVSGAAVSLGSKTSANSLPVVIASDQAAMTVVGTATSVTPTLTVTASVYTAGNCIGGKLTLTNAMRVSGGTGVLESITLTDHGNQKPPLDILFFASSPAATFTDHSAFPTMSVADNALVIARVSIAASDWVTIGGSAYVCKNGLGISVAATGSATLYAAMNTSGTPTPAATTDLTMVVGFLTN